MSFAEKVYRFMLHRGLNQQRLARLSGVSDSEISRILRGKSSPSLEYATRIARALGVSLDYLVDEGRGAGDGEAIGVSNDLEREVVRLAGSLGPRQARHLLETALYLGFDEAMSRLTARATSGPGDGAVSGA
jgi:transcriptional regulator with XRE-family HTH domain